jgi:hypothetical protein
MRKKSDEPASGGRCTQLPGSDVKTDSEAACQGYHADTLLIGGALDIFSRCLYVEKMSTFDTRACVVACIQHPELQGGHRAEADRSQVSRFGAGAGISIPASRTG